MIRVSRGTAYFVIGTALYFFQNCSQVRFVELPSVVVPICRDVKAEEVAPRLKWDWYAQMDKTNPASYPQFSQVMATPMVADLDGDGRPEVVFSSWTNDSSLWDPNNINSSTGKVFASYSTNGVLRIVSGTDGATLKSIGDLSVAPFATTSPLLIDLDSDGKIEIVYAHYKENKVIALNSDGSVRWTYFASGETRSRAGLNAADFNRDGRPDIILGKEVIYENAQRQAQKLFDLQTSGNRLYRFGFALDYEHPLDFSIVGGDGIFDSSGALKFSITDMFYAVADFDTTNPGFELVGVSGGLLKVLAANSGQTLKSVDITLDGTLQCPNNRGIGGGHPTIGDFDGDSATSEIAIATGKYMAVFDHNLNLIAKSETQDCSSLSTGLSSFDFNGDGHPEILYGDEEYLRVYELKNGVLEVVAKIINPSGTLLEYPVVVDVDGDGATDMVVASNNYAAGSFYKDAGETQDQAAATQITGVRAFESSGQHAWMPAGKIWNQYQFHPALFDARGKVSQKPIKEGSYLSRLFRTNLVVADKPLTCRPSALFKKARDF